MQKRHVSFQVWQIWADIVSCRSFLSPWLFSGSTCVISIAMGNMESFTYTYPDRSMGPTWIPSGADRTQVVPFLAPWILLSGYACMLVYGRQSFSTDFLSLFTFLHITQEYLMALSYYIDVVSILSNCIYQHQSDKYLCVRSYHPYTNQHSTRVYNTTIAHVAASALFLLKLWFSGGIHLRIYNKHTHTNISYIYLYQLWEVCVYVYKI